MQNGFIESFNGRLRDELLNETLFSSLNQARSQLANWREDYNTSRPHSALGWKTPTEYATTLHPRRALELRNTNCAGTTLKTQTVQRDKTKAGNEIRLG